MHYKPERTWCSTRGLQVLSLLIEAVFNLLQHNLICVVVNKEKNTFKV